MKKTMLNKVKKIKLRARKLYIKNIYSNRVKNKFLKKEDVITGEYAEEVQNYWRFFNININSDWHKWYSSNNKIEDPRYIPDHIFYNEIEPYYNRLELSKAYHDKSFYDFLFNCIKKPITIIKNQNGIYYDKESKVLSLESALLLCSNYEEVIIKPSIDGAGGQDIAFIKNHDKKLFIKQIKEILNRLNKDFVIQLVLSQHEKLNLINPSINTIRVMSFFRKNEVVILSSILRMGVNNSRLDNVSSGGISCGIQSNGSLKKYAFDKYGNKFSHHPQGYKFEGNIIPSYDKVIEIIKRQHLRFGHFKILSWDFAIDNNGDPVFIEFNNSSQGLNTHQINNGPLFGDLTDEILEEIFIRDNK